MAERSGVLTHTDGNESTRAILQDVLRDVANILHAEVRLARAEVKEDLRTAGRAGGLFGAAALCGVLAAASLTACLIAGLSLIMPIWLAALLAALFLACMSAAFYAGGRDRTKQMKPPFEETKQKVRSDYQWVKQQMK
jgi:Putative Actinobacterial Holin-X, holin superfamily III